MDAVEGARTQGAYALAWETLTEINDSERAAVRRSRALHAAPPTVQSPHALASQFPADPDRAVPSRVSTSGTAASPRTWTSSRTGICGRATRSRTTSCSSRRRRRSTACPPVRAMPPAGRSGSTAAYQDAVNRQRELRVTLSPRQISQMAEDYARSQSLVMVSRSDVRQLRRRAPVARANRRVAASGVRRLRGR